MNMNPFKDIYNPLVNKIIAYDKEGIPWIDYDKIELLKGAGQATI